jgi:hypothetical protein
MSRFTPASADAIAAPASASAAAPAEALAEGAAEAVGADAVALVVVSGFFSQLSHPPRDMMVLMASARVLLPTTTIRRTDDLLGKDARIGPANGALDKQFR